MLRLLLPALIPSWRFFARIGPSPRVEYALLAAAGDPAPVWQEFRPRPPRLAASARLGRLFWNPLGNETLFVLGCAERICDGERGFPEREIRARIARSLRGSEAAERASWLAFRIVESTRRGERVAREVVFVSRPERLAEAEPAA